LIPPLRRFYRPGSTHGKGVTGRLGTGAKTRTSADDSRSSSITPFIFSQIERFLSLVGCRGVSLLSRNIFHRHYSRHQLPASISRQPHKGTSPASSTFCAFPRHPLGYRGVPKALNEWSCGSKERPRCGWLKFRWIARF